MTNVSARHLSAALIYQLSWRMKFLGIYLVFYLIFSIGIPLTIAVVGTGGTTDGYVDVMTPAIIFSGTVAMIGSKLDFRFLLFNGLTRTMMFLCSVIVLVVASAATTAVVVASRLLLSVGSLPIRSGSLVADQYAAGSVPTASAASALHGTGVAVMTLVVFLLVMVVSSFMGVLMTRLGRRGRLTFGALVFLVPTLVGFLLSRVDTRSLLRWLRDFGEAFLGIRSDGALDFRPLSMTLLAVAFLFMALAWLVGRRRGVDRVVQK
ncbi:hypothetical protein BMIN_1450 [Bifidobacterium minimum]|uniref:Uncharacterized protein n=2 Tax=Bifidobacterium minimum TaxID=1693 RepID=A0A087BL85_9BIFI|nr:hypothetical protein BMIN_1450 [Bifidobacterium minimum]